MEEKKISLEVVHPDAAGIDIGSRSHWVAVGQNAEDVKEFGVYSDDHQALCNWLKEKGVMHVAMESTGTYWQNLFSALIVEGFEVILVNGKQTKNLKGKKTDIKDCQWIQKLHTLGLLSKSFLPDSTTDIIRTYSRHKLNLLNQSANCIKRMQKYLRLMNMRLEVVVRDIVGETGSKIISEFISGTKDGKKLAQNRHYNLLRSIPGIGGFLASAVIAECGDLRRFANEKQFSSYIGVVPGIYSSGGNETMLGVTPRSKSLLRTYIIESAWVALRYDQEIQAYYRKHASKNPKSVIVKIAHKMVKRMLSVIKNGQPYRVNNTINKLKEEKEKQ